MTRGKGDGGVWQDSRGLWRASVELPPTVEEGKTKRRRKVVSSKNKKILMQKLREAQKDLAHRGDLSTKTITLDAWIDKWLTDIAPTTRTPKTMASYRSTLNRHVSPRLGTRPLDRLTAGMIRDAIKDMQNATPTKKGASSGTARNAHSYLSAVLSDAVNDGWISNHPMEHLPLPRANRKTARALTVEQAVQLLRWLGQQMDKPAGEDLTQGLASLWVTYLLTGARRGELLGLTPDRVTEDEISLEWQLQRFSPAAIASAPTDYEHRHLTDNFYLVRPKSKAGWRSYPLVEPLRSFLHRVVSEAPEDGLLFRTPDGRPWDPDKITDRWADMLELAGIEDHVTLHGARHTVVDLLYILEVPEPIIMEIVGHSSRQVTRGYRSKYGPAVQKAMEQMSLLMQTGTAPQIRS